ncbi:response regulator [Panacibacter ginsenosidivorans]|uniref:Response regulator n=1 Tax=Panacibacter ginsenosidivorans TaxID=1813871 RepID=A0A5B8V8H1_9BACT|nr:response regulator [Panacibacter ginsenosidivorans]
MKQLETSVRKKISKALIVDDEIDICYLLEGILKKKSVWSTYVNTLSDAQIMLRKETPSIIFLDNHLPDGLGVEFIDHIKKYYPSTKVVIITAVDSSSDRKMAYEHGADYFISKPFNMEIIYNVVEKLK